MKRILVFIDWYLPGYKAGGPIRSVANMVEHLSDEYKFLIVTRNTDYLEDKPYPDICPNEWIKRTDNQQVIYLSKKQVSIKKIKQLVRETEFDLVYVNGVYSFYFSVLPLVLMRYFSDKKIIVAPRGMLSAQGLGVKSLKKKAFVIISRLIGLYKKVTLHVTSNGEQEDIEQLKLKPGLIYPVPNMPPKVSNNEVEKIEKRTGELKLISIARISPEKNTLFALKCLKNYKYNGEIEFDLYGSVYQQSYWKQCKDCIDKLPANIKVSYRGELNNSLVSNKLRQYHFLFLPSIGENFGHSLLESLLAACPVIISNKTPWRELEHKNVGWDIDLKTPEIFAKRIQHALDLANEEYTKMSENAQSYAISKTNSNQTKLSYYKLFG